METKYIMSSLDQSSNWLIGMLRFGFFFSKPGSLVSKVKAHSLHFFLVTRCYNILSDDAINHSTLFNHNVIFENDARMWMVIMLNGGLLVSPNFEL